MLAESDFVIALPVLIAVFVVGLIWACWRDKDEISEKEQKELWRKLNMLASQNWQQKPSPIPVSILPLRWVDAEDSEFSKLPCVEIRYYETSTYKKLQIFDGENWMDVPAL